jgi:hypothetical protein
MTMILSPMDVYWVGGYSFFDSSDVELVANTWKSQYHNVGE